MPNIYFEAATFSPTNAPAIAYAQLLHVNDADGITTILTINPLGQDHAFASSHANDHALDLACRHADSANDALHSISTPSGQRPPAPRTAREAVAFLKTLGINTEIEAR